jgi:hypothetical protein
VVELAAVFRRYGPAYRTKFGRKMPPSHRQAMRAIEHCRTPALGGHVYTCPDCGATQYQYHSCRNRHCPKCQNDKAQQWLEQQQALRLPGPPVFQRGPARNWPGTTCQTPPLWSTMVSSSPQQCRIIR